MCPERKSQRQGEIRREISRLLKFGELSVLLSLEDHVLEAQRLRRVRQIDRLFDELVS